MDIERVKIVTGTNVGLPISSEIHDLKFLHSLEYCLLSLLYLVRRSSILYVLEKKKFLSS